MLREVSIGCNNIIEKDIQPVQRESKAQEKHPGNDVAQTKWLLSIWRVMEGRGESKSTEQGVDLAKTYKGFPGIVVTDVSCVWFWVQSLNSLLWADLWICSFHLIAQPILLLYTLNINSQYMVDIIHIPVTQMQTTSTCDTHML